MAGPKTGEVFLQDFDRGVVTTLGGEITKDERMYVIKNIPGIDPPPDFEGTPVYFAFSDDVLSNKIIPSFVVRRDSMLPAMARWHLGAFEYRIPAATSHPVTITHPISGREMATGFDKYETKDQAVPFDLLYTIQILGRYRNNLSADSLKMLHYAMKKYQPYTTLYIKDSLGEDRSYDAFMESPSVVDSKTTVEDRRMSFNMTLRVEAELDLNDPVVVQAMSSLPNLVTKIK